MVDHAEIQESNEHNNTDNNSHHDEILHTIKVKFEKVRMIDFSLHKRFQKPPKPKMKKLEESIKEVNEVMTNFDFCVDNFTDFNCLRSIKLPMKRTEQSCLKPLKNACLH